MATTSAMYQDIEILSCTGSHVAKQGRRAVPGGGKPMRCVAKELEAGRLRKKLTLEQLAERVKMPPHVLTRYETAQAEPDVCAMHILQRELELPP